MSELGFDFLTPLDLPEGYSEALKTGGLSVFAPGSVLVNTAVYVAEFGVAQAREFMPPEVVLNAVEALERGEMW